MTALAVALVLVAAVLAVVSLIQSRWQSLVAWGLLALSIAVWIAWSPSVG